MGHYERLLIQSLRLAGAADECRFDIRFSGRAPEGGVSEGQLDAALKGATFTGFSLARLASLPWPLVQMTMAMTHGGVPPDLFHSLSLGYPAPSHRPAVYTIHDLPPAHFDDEGTVPRWAKQAAKAAHAIITPSQFATNDLIELLEVPQERVHTIPYGCEHDIFHPGVAPADAATLTEHGLTQPFLLYAGGFTRRKNVRALLQAWKNIAPNQPNRMLALVGPTERLKALAAEADAPRVVVVGYLPHAILRALLKASEGLIFPSIYEGFGLPPLEAMALGVPVIGVNAGAVPEVTAGAALLAPDGSAESLTETMASYFADPGIAARLREAGPKRAQDFSWSRHAAQVLEVYRQAVG